MIYVLDSTANELNGFHLYFQSWDQRESIFDYRFKDSIFV